MDFDADAESSYEKKLICVRNRLSEREEILQRPHTRRHRLVDHHGHRRFVPQSPRKLPSLSHPHHHPRHHHHHHQLLPANKSPFPPVQPSPRTAASLAAAYSSTTRPGRPPTRSPSRPSPRRPSRSHTYNASSQSKTSSSPRVTSSSSAAASRPRTTR